MAEAEREAADEIMAKRLRTLIEQMLDPSYGAMAKKEALEILSNMEGQIELLKAQLSEAVRCLMLIESIGYGGAPDIAMRKAARVTLKHIAAIASTGQHGND